MAQTFHTYLCNLVYNIPMTKVKLSLKAHLAKKYQTDQDGNLTGAGISKLAHDLRIDRRTARKIASDEGDSIHFATLEKIIDFFGLKIEDVLDVSTS